MLVYHRCKLVYDTLIEIKLFLEFLSQGPNQNVLMNVLQDLKNAFTNTPHPI